jgi:Protein kinase domain
MTDSQAWWTDDRIQTTVTREYILKQFRLEEQDLLKQSISFGDGLNDHTYLAWILERAKRFFLILTYIGVPGLIFGLVAKSYDDADLPIAADAVKNLQLSSGSDNSLDKRFYIAQFKYLFREIKQGYHIRFLDEEIIPVKVVGSTGGTNRSGKDGVDRVHLASDAVKLYGRKRVLLEEAPNYLTAADVLSEIAFAKNLAHQHVFSVYGSYGHEKSIFVLLTPCAEYTLNSFLDSPPRHFENLPKAQRREILLNWPHCLANGLAWLHSNHRHHGALRPSNIMIDHAYRICLGQLEGLPTTHGYSKSSDIESYQYAAPERWKRAATMQTKAPAMLALHSGGRTARRPSASKHSASSSVNDPYETRASITSPMSSSFPIDTSKPTSTAYSFIPTSKTSTPRVQAKAHDISDYAASILSSNSSGTRQDRSHSLWAHSNSTNHQSRSKFTNSTSAGRSPRSNHSSDGGHHMNSTMANSVTVAPTEIRSALVQTWQSAQVDSLAADIFSYGAIVLEIITFLCKRSASAFARHRSAKNRTAGRGGGVADASFHANLGQVFSWTVSLEQDARKKALKDGAVVFNAVGPIIDVARECLARSAKDRPDADVVENTLESYLKQFTSSATTHCTLQIHPRDNKFGTTGFSRSAIRSLPISGVDEKFSSLRKQPSQSSKRRGGLNADEKPNITNSSLASFNFDDYNLDEESLRSVYGEVGETFMARTRYSTPYPDDETIDLQSIADRPDRIQNGTDISGWSHMHTDSRASYVSFGTHSDSNSEPQHLETFFKPASRPPSLPAKDITPTQPSRALSSQSSNYSQPSNTARKRTTGDASRQHHKTSTLDSTSQRSNLSGRDRTLPPKTSSSADSTQKRYGSIGPATTDSSIDSPRHRHSILSSTDASRGRLSVSTLASNSSTIRLSWQPRDVSPISLRNANRASNASNSALGDAVSGSEAEETDLDVEIPAPLSSSRKGDLSSAEKMYRTLQRNRGMFGDGAPGGLGAGEKGKKKVDAAGGVRDSTAPGAKRTWLPSRYSLLGGRM